MSIEDHAFKTASKRAIQKTAETTGDLITNKIGDKIIKGSETLPQNNSGTVTNKKEDIGLNRERLANHSKLLMIYD